MFDTMTLTKAGAGLCAAFLLLLLGNWAAREIYEVGGYHGDHHDQAYAIEVEDGDHGGEESNEPEVPFAEVYAAADAAAGERLWRPCAACHKLEDGANGTGPHLYSIVGRDKGAVSGFAYSDAMLASEGDWTPESLSQFIENPKAYVEGTKMVYRGMDDVEDRANLIAYLATIGG